MGKALMITGHGESILSGGEHNLFGYQVTLTEANTQYEATEAATFSLLRGAISSGGSGTNTCQFRKNGANGNLVMSRAGTGVMEDVTNTDVLAATDLFNLAFTDTGTTPVYATVRAVVEFSSGHGNFYGSGSFGPPIFDVASATRFLPLSGILLADGTATEANVAFRIRGATTFAALQVRVTANARTNDATVKNRIAAADGTGSITIGSGLTGLFKDTAIGDAIADGDAICASLTLGTGVEDLNISIVGATLTASSGSKSEVWLSYHTGFARAASATANYYALGGSSIIAGLTNEAGIRQSVGFAGTASNLRCYLSANTYGDAATLKLFQNGAAVLTTTIGAGGGAGWYENTADSVAFDADDELSYEIVGGTSGSITIMMIGMTLDSEVAAGGGFFARHYYDMIAGGQHL